MYTNTPNDQPNPHAYADATTKTQGDYLAPPHAYYTRLSWSEFSLGRKLVVIAALTAIGSVFFPWISIGTVFMAPITLSGLQTAGFMVLIPLIFVLVAAMLPLRGRRMGWMLRNPQWSDSRISITGSGLGLAWLAIRMLGMIEYAAIGYWVAVLALITIMVGGWIMRQHGE